MDPFQIFSADNKQAGHSESYDQRRALQDNLVLNFSCVHPTYHLSYFPAHLFSHAVNLLCQHYIR